MTPSPIVPTAADRRLAEKHVDYHPMKTADRLAALLRQARDPETREIRDTDEARAAFRRARALLDELAGRSERSSPRCAACGRPLERPSSVEAGIGPECASKARAAEVRWARAIAAELDEVDA